MATKIYTNTEDKGNTKVSKNNIRIEAYQTLDELNAHMGLTHDLLTHQHSKDTLLEIQDRLFTLSSSIASDPDKKTHVKIHDLKESDIQLLENEMDYMNRHLPEMESPIRPVGHPTISNIHITRCICLRTQRLVIQLHNDDYVHPLVIKYLYCLGDYLFTLARYVGQILEVKDIPWKPRVS